MSLQCRTRVPLSLEWLCLDGGGGEGREGGREEGDYLGASLCEHSMNVCYEQKPTLIIIL